MLVRSLMVIGTIALLASAGCRNADAVGCTETAACPGGHVCLHGVCTQRCDNDDSCPAGQHCADAVCVEGASSRPTISAVTSSDGSTTDPTCNKPLENTTCLGSHLTVHGSNLAGATYTLTAVGNAAVTFPLTVGDGATASQANLLFAFADQAEADAQLLPGNYTLSAVNEAGSAQVVISLLKGASSASFVGADIIAAINAETTGTISSDRLELPRADDLIDEINLGTGQIDGARVAGAGSIHVQRTAATAGTAVRVDDATFLTMCSDEDGCEITLGASYSNYNAAVPHDPPNPAVWVAVPAVRFGMGCRFHIDDTGNWAVPNYCYTTYKVWNGAVDAYATTYTSWGYGKDGYDGPINDGSDRRTVLAYWPGSLAACILSETDPGVGGADSTVGLFFYMNGTTDASFNHASRTCELVIKD